MAKKEKRDTQVCLSNETKICKCSNVNNLVSRNIRYNLQVQLDQQGSKENEEKMENLDFQGKWDPKESKEILVQKETRANSGYLDFKDLKVNWDLLGQWVSRGRLDFEETEEFQDLSDPLVDQVPRGKLAFQATKAMWAIVGRKAVRVI